MPRRHGSLTWRRRPCHPLLSVRGLSSATATALRGRREGASAQTPDSSASGRPQLTCPEPLQLLHRAPKGSGAGHLLGNLATCSQRRGRVAWAIGQTAPSALVKGLVASSEPEMSQTGTAETRGRGGARGGSRCSGPGHAGLALHLPVVAPEGACCRGGIRHWVDVTLSRGKRRPVHGVAAVMGILGTLGPSGTSPFHQGRPRSDTVLPNSLLDTNSYPLADDLDRSPATGVAAGRLGESPSARTSQNKPRACEQFIRVMLTRCLHCKEGSELANGHKDWFPGLTSHSATAAGGPTHRLVLGGHGLHAAIPLDTLPAWGHQ